MSIPPDHKLSVSRTEASKLLSKIREMISLCAGFIINRPYLLCFFRPYCLLPLFPFFSLSDKPLTESSIGACAFSLIYLAFLIHVFFEGFGIIRSFQDSVGFLAANKICKKDDQNREHLFN